MIKSNVRIKTIDWKKRKPIYDLEGCMFVDPGFFTGITFFEDGFQTIQLELSKDTKEAQLKDKHIELWKDFKSIINLKDPQKVYFEDVTVRDDQQSLVSAKSGNLLKLDRLLGGYQAICTMLDIPYSTIRVVDWKGNMNDEQVQHRIKWLTGLEFDSPHVADSFGMSLNEMGIFK